MKKLATLAVLTGLMTLSCAQAAAPKQLTLGILGGQNSTQQIGDNQCVKSYFDKALNVETKLNNASDYSAIIQGLKNNKIDVVLSMSPASFASVYIENPQAVDVVGIAADDSDKSKGYHSVVVVKADSPYKTLDDLKGKSFGFADPDSTSGYLFPNKAFQDKFGKDANMDNKYNGFFSSVTFSGGHEQDILGVLNGQFEGAVTWTSMIGDYNTGYTSGSFGRLIRAGHPDLMKQIRIIWESPLIPNGPILVNHKLDADFKAKLIAAIKTLDKDHHDCFIKAMGGKQHIVPATVKDYEKVIEMKRDLMNAGRS